MKIFISWSGPRSLLVAEALHKWLPRVLHVVRPYLSIEDTAKGAYWVSEVKHQLDTSSFGIICLTPDNLNAPWINFEAGALSKSFERGSVSPFLFGVTQDAITGPLTQFQMTEARKPNDVLRLIKDLDAASGDRAVGERVAEDSFEVWWPHLEHALQRISTPPMVGPRPTDDMVRELLNGQRTLERLLSDVMVRQAANVPGPDMRAELEETLKELSQALGACGDSDDPAIKQVAAQAATVRALCEKMTGSRLRWEPLRKRANAEQRGLTAGDT